MQKKRHASVLAHVFSVPKADGVMMLRTINVARSSSATEECCFSAGLVFQHKPVPKLSFFLAARATRF